MVLVLNRQQVLDLVEMPALVDAIEAGLIEAARGGTINPNRLRVFVPERQAMMACMPAYLDSLAVLGAKIVSSSSRSVPAGRPRAMSALVVLSDTEGRFLSVMSGTQLGALRTAAASAVAIRRLARPDASTMAIVGCGVQGRAELAGALAVRRLSAVFAYDIDASVAQAFARDMAGHHGVPVTIADSADAAAAQADIVALATTSAVPVVSAAAIRPGTHVNAVGAHTPTTRELDGETVAGARLFAESRDALLAEAGDVLIPLREGRFMADHVLGELGQVAAGTLAGRTGPDDITIFKSTGIAIEDVVAAKLVYDRAVATGVGIAVDL